MSDTEIRAIAIALGDEPADPALEDEVLRARRDIERIRRGIELTARGAPATPVRPARRRWLPVAAAAAAAVAVAGIATALVTRDDSTAPTVSPSPTTPTSQPAVNAQRSADLSLSEKVAQADAIVVGTITRLDRGEVGGLPYVLATVEVSETIEGEPSSTVVAFDYDLDSGDAVTSAGAGTPWNVGDEVLLFLVSDAGTVSEDLEPAHLQVAEGARGRFAVVDGELVNAPFTLDDVRTAAR